MPTCALKDSPGCRQTPWVISVLGSARGHLALERGSICCMAPPGFPAQQGSGACPVQAAGCSPVLPAACSCSLGALLRPEASSVPSLTAVTPCFPRVGDVVSSMAQQEPLA